MKSCQKLCCNHMTHQESFLQCLKLRVGDLWHQQWISNTLHPCKPQLQEQSAHSVMLILSWYHDTEKLIVHCPVPEWWMLPGTTWKIDLCHQGNLFIHSAYRFIWASELPWSQDVPQSNGGYLDCSTMTDTKLLSLPFLLPLQSCKFVWRSLSTTAQQGNNTAQ